MNRLILLLSCNMYCPWINTSMAGRAAVLETLCFSFFNLIVFFSRKIIITEFCLGSYNSFKTTGKTV